MTAHSLVTDFCYLQPATDEEQGLPLEYFNYSWDRVTIATQKHSWREQVQDRSLWQNMSPHSL